MDLSALFSQYWAVGMGSLLLSFLMTRFAVRNFVGFGLIDRPHLYGKKRAPIPYYGGLVLFLCFVICAFLFLKVDMKVLMLLLASSLIVGVGFVDDKFKVSPWVRLLVQFLAGGLLVFSGVMIEVVNLPFVGEVSFGAFSAVLTILWLMTFVNSMNFIDGVSGLNSGVTFIAGLTFFFLSTNPLINENLASQVPVATLSLILAGTALGFLFFDFPKPMILMGDTGSTLFGFLIGALAIFSGGKVATAFLVLGLPLLDMVWVVVRRTMEGKRFWQGDLKHLHHRLLDLGWSDKKVVFNYLFLTALFGFGSVFLVNAQQKLYMILGVVMLMVLLFAALVFLPRK